MVFIVTSDVNDVPKGTIVHYASFRKQMGPVLLREIQEKLPELKNDDC
jgi:hypothetical protein